MSQRRRAKSERPVAEVVEVDEANGKKWGLAWAGWLVRDDERGPEVEACTSLGVWPDEALGKPSLADKVPSSKVGDEEAPMVTTRKKKKKGRVRRPDDLKKGEGQGRDVWWLVMGEGAKGCPLFDNISMG